MDRRIVAQGLRLLVPTLAVVALVLDMPAAQARGGGGGGGGMGGFHGGGVGAVHAGGSGFAGGRAAAGAAAVAPRGAGGPPGFVVLRAPPGFRPGPTPRAAVGVLSPR